MSTRISTFYRACGKLAVLILLAAGLAGCAGSVRLEGTFPFSIGYWGYDHHHHGGYSSSYYHRGGGRWHH